MSDTWCQMVWHQIVDAGPHTYLSTPPVVMVGREAHSLCQQLMTLGGYVVLHQQLVSIPFGTVCHSLHSQWCHLWQV